MTATTTVYDVKIRYMLTDKASKGLRAIAKQSAAAGTGTTKLHTSLKRVNTELSRSRNRASKAAAAFKKIGMAARMSRGGGGGFSLGLGGIAAAAGGYFGISKAIDATIGFNRELATTEAQLRTIIQLNTGRTFETSTKEAQALMGQLRQDAKTSAGTFKEMVTFSSAIAGPITRVGGSLQDLREITKGAVVAAAAFGERADLAQLDITQALAGTLGAKDRFAKAILGPMKITTEAFNKLSSKKRLEVLKQAFNQKGIKEAAQAYQTSFEGVFSTFQSNLQEFGGKVGQKLFARLSVELQRLNKWFDANEQRVNAIADKLAKGLVKAFEFAKKTFAFVIKHKDMLVLVAKAFLASKAIGGITGIMGSIGNAMQSFTGKLGLATSALSALAIGAQAIADIALEKQEKRIERGTANPHLRELARFLGGAPGTVKMSGMIRDLRVRAKQQGFRSDRELAAVRVAQEATRIGYISRGRVNVNKIASNFNTSGNMFEEAAFKGALAAARETAMSRHNIALEKLDAGFIAKLIEEQNTSGVKDVERLTTFLRGLDKAVGVSSQLGIMLRADAVKSGQKASESTTKDKRGLLTVNKMVVQVESNDPDRFALGLEGLFNDLVKNGAQAAAAQRGF